MSPLPRIIHAATSPERPRVPYVQVCIVSGLMGILGAKLIFLQAGEERPPYLAAIPSILTWLFLARYVVGKPYSKAVLVGLVSPLVAALAGIPFLLYGVLMILAAMVKCW